MFVFVRFWLVKFKLPLLQRKAVPASEESCYCFREKQYLLQRKAVPASEKSCYCFWKKAVAALKTSSSSVSRVSYCLIYSTMNYELEIQ